MLPEKYRIPRTKEEPTPGEGLGQERHLVERRSSIILQEETGMDLFTQIKMAVSVKEAAEYYGLEVNRGSMTCCPFHADRTPSMKLNEDFVGIRQ